MKCTASKCSVRTLVKAPRSVDREFFLKDFICGQCSVERLHLTKQSVDEAKLAISEVKREICNIQEQLKNAWFVDLWKIPNNMRKAQKELRRHLTLKRNSDPSAVFYIRNNRIIKLSKQQHNEKVPEALSAAAPI
ncbi:hypothetical protein GJ496_005832 [Pomphorhynchus laevis]|nr:hypothetical protein GJ496_005832 [Pomphorhynchus laevis]